jgi:hypothetical protein
MRSLRTLCAALLLIVFMLGVPLHDATAHGVAPMGTTTMRSAHVHDHGKGQCCPEHHRAKSGPGELCRAVCSTAVAVLDAPTPSLGTRLAYAVRFAAGPPTSARGATLKPDPFPPRPSRIA